MMTPIRFKHSNVVYAENQPEYLPLPAFNDGERAVSCWRLTMLERLKVLCFGQLWLIQLHFGESLQPQLPTVDCPIIENKSLIEPLER